MSAVRRRTRLGIVAVLSALLVALPMRVHAQTDTGRLEILYLEHDPRGTLTIGLRAGDRRDTPVEGLNVFVDDVPIPLDPARRTVQRPLAVVILLDASGSMAGEPIRAAQAAARDLVRRLPEGDRVGVTVFADRVSHLAPLTRDRGAVLAALDGVQAGGDTSLYDAVSQAAGELSTVPDADRVVVLLSDGRDSAGPLSPVRAASIQRVKDVGAKVYAVGLGAGYDEAYLSAVAEAPGRLIPVRDGAGLVHLQELFARLGGMLGASEGYVLRVGALRQGTHHVQLRGVIGGGSTSASSAFEATNAGLLQPSVEPDLGSVDELRIRVAEAVSDLQISLEARIGERVLPARVSGDTLVLDPWRLPPGEHAVEVAGRAQGALVSREAVTIRVPVLDPRLDRVDRGDGTVIRGRLQAAEVPTVVVEGRDGSRSTGTGEVGVPEPSEPFVAQLLDSEGRVVLTREFEAASLAGGGSALMWFPVAVGIVVLVASVAWWLRRRSRGRIVTESPLLRRALHVPAPPDDLAAAVRLASEAREPSASMDRPAGVILVEGGPMDGSSIPLARRPIVVGSGRECDVVVSGTDVRPRHATISLLPTGEIQIHAHPRPDRGARPYLGVEEDEWLVLHDGEQVIIGSTSLRFVAQGAAPPDARGPGVPEVEVRG